MIGKLFGPPGPHPIFGDPRKNWGWLLGFGVLSTILGVFGLGMLFTLTLASGLAFGLLLAAAGGIQFVDAFKREGWRRTLLQMVVAALYLVVGVFMIMDPLSAAVAVTLVLGSALVVVGVVRIFSALQQKHEKGWKWVLVGGVLSVLFGVFVLVGWPVSGLWVLGLIVAVELMVSGWRYIFYGLAARKVAQRAAEEAVDPR
ncbi:HdeD family acid-resistance protein [Thioalkalicoccus limnaeus]|uniref:HdeD family acid-resistance protein n=1 Tax=Thioalkalicoccus limnaeus TaxID=120681 RepID=A0ABV4BGI8_9GAMM